MGFNDQVFLTSFRFIAKRTAVGLLGWFLIFDLAAQTPRERWVDSVFNQLSTEEKIGQLFMLSVSPDIDEQAIQALERQVNTNHVGGILYTNGAKFNHRKINERLQSVSRIPLLMAMGRPFSSGIDNDSLHTFPTIPMQGAIADDSLIFQFGEEVGRQMKLMGIHMNFIPANLAGNTNLEGSISYGENRFTVASKAMAFWRGLRAEGVLATAQYFPVQGLSVTTLEKGLPSMQLTVDSLQAYPFKVLFRNEIPAVMPASTDLPLFYSKRKTAMKNTFSSATLSASFAGEWIRRNMNYEGLIMIDVESMIRSSDKFKNGDAEVFAFRAGNDMLVTSTNVNAALRKMKRLLRKESRYLPFLDLSVKKILNIKYDANLGHTPMQNSLADGGASATRTRLLRERMYRATTTVVANKKNVLPVQTLDNKIFTCVIAGDSAKGNVFARQLAKYVPVKVRYATHDSTDLHFEENARLQHVIIAAIFSETTPEVIKALLPALQEVRINRDVVICDFGSALFRERAGEFETVITGYSDADIMLKTVAQSVFGALPATGILPVAFGTVASGQRIPTTTLDRLSYSFPEEVGIDSKTLEKIQAIATEAIEGRATPGCQVLVARNGKVVYERSFGHLTYEQQIPVSENTVYDLASLTKVSATLQIIMFLHEKGLIDIHKKASAYLPELKNTNKEDFTLKDILTHQAGLWPFLPFWSQTMKDSVYLPEFYSATLSREYPLVVSDHLFAPTAMRDSLWSWILKARVREKPVRTPYDYRYSDMGFYILHRLADKLLNQPMEDFLWQNLYEPLGAYTAGYRPLVRFPIDQIAPTENDRLFRKSLLIGTVHDQGAAMLGGVAGHAGLFGNATALAKLGQMLLQEGRYGGIQYYKPETIKLFTEQQFENNRRGLGWDRPTGDWDGPTGIYASPRTFGHTGFTGTCLWVDPEFELVYVFLSNRVHPDMTNNKLLTDNIRPRIQDVIYQAIFNYCKTADTIPEGPESIPLDAMGKLHNK